MNLKEFPRFEWGLYFLQDRLKVRCSRMHPLLADALGRGGKKKALVVGPRWHAKTTWGPLNNALYHSCERPLGLIRLSSNTSTLAEKTLFEIRKELKENRFLIDAYSSWLPRKWKRDNQDEIILPNGVRLIAKGFMHIVRGEHPDLELPDDIEDAKDVGSELVRQHTEEQFLGTVAGSWQPQTMVLITANYTHPLCFAKKLFDNRFENSKGVELSDAEWTRIKFESGYHAGRPIWEEQWPMEELEKQRKLMGWQRFDAEFENRPEFYLEPVIKREWFRHYSPEEVGRGHLNAATLFIKYDAGFSLKDSADEFAAGLWARFHEGPFRGETRLLKWFANRALLDDNCRALLGWVEDYGGRPTILHFEREGKDTIVVRQTLDRLLAQERQNCRQITIGKEEFPGDKRQRLMAVSGMFQQEEIWFPQGNSEKIETQILMLGEGDHDDLVDVVSDAAWYSKTKLAPRDRKPEDYGTPVVAVAQTERSLTTHPIRAGQTRKSYPWQS